MHNPSPVPLDDYLPAGVRQTLEARFWRTVEESSTLEALRDDASIASAVHSHPALFADHGVVHARNVAAGVVDLAETAEGVLLPERPPERRAFVVGLGVLLAYLHDAGMSDPTPRGRQLHALVAAQLPFSGAIDDVIDELLHGDGAVVRRIKAVAAEAPFVVPLDVVLRELWSLTVAHSKSTVRSELLADVQGLRATMQRAILVDLDGHGRADATLLVEPLPTTVGAAARWYEDPVGDAFAWLGGHAAAHRALAEDAIDAVRLVRAADALRQRGTSLRTAAGYEIFIDADTGAAVFALRTKGGEQLLLLRADSPLSAGEANIRSATVTPQGDLRIAFHRGRFPTSAATASAREATARVAADVVSDVLGAFGARQPSPDLPSPRRDPGSMEVQLERPADEPSFAADVAAEIGRHAPDLAPRLAVAADLENATPRERVRYHRGIPVPAGSSETTEVLRALGEHGLKVDAIDAVDAFEDVRRVGLEPGETLLEAGSPPAFVYISMGPGLRVRPLGGYDDADAPAWVPIGITGVVRRAERNSTVTAAAPVDVLMIPGELFARAWFRPYGPDELAELFTAVRPDG